MSRGQQAAGEEPVEEVLPDLEGFGNSQIARKILAFFASQGFYPMPLSTTGPWLMLLWVSCSRGDSFSVWDGREIS